MEDVGRWNIQIAYQAVVRKTKARVVGGITDQNHSSGTLVFQYCKTGVDQLTANPLALPVWADGDGAKSEPADMICTDPHGGEGDMSHHLARIVGDQGKGQIAVIAKSIDDCTFGSVAE